MRTFLSWQARKQSILTVVFVFALSLTTFGQSKLVAAHNPAAAAVRDLNSSLFDLTRVAAVTERDLSAVGGGKVRWLTFWRRDSAHKAQIATALRRNLQLAMPGLVHDAQASNGSLSATFKLYNDLNVVCESLDSLVSSGGRPNKAKYADLSGDLSEMTRIREELAAHIQQTAALLEGRNPELASVSGRPKKIIIDDDIPDKPNPRKHKSPR
jgi:hypothetical protein